MVAVRAIAARGRKKKVRAARVPRMVEARYLLALRRELQILKALIREDVIPRIPSILAQVPAEIRADDGGAEKIRFDDFDSELEASLNAVKVQFLGRVRPMVERAARDAARATSAAQKEDHDREVQAVLGLAPENSEPWLRDFINNFVRTNVRLVEDLSESALDGVEKRIAAGARQGLQTSAIAAQIQSDFLQRGETITDRRAKLIARDQIGSLYGELARARQKKLGIKRYIWRTSQDERVRETHAAREGEIFTWDPIEPQLRAKGLKVDKIDGIPGVPIACRCTAEPIFDDEDFEEEETPQEEQELETEADEDVDFGGGSDFDVDALPPEPEPPPIEPEPATSPKNIPKIFEELPIGELRASPPLTDTVEFEKRLRSASSEELAAITRFTGSEYVQLRAVQQTKSFEEARDQLLARGFSEYSQRDYQKDVKTNQKLGSVFNSAQPTPARVFRGICLKDKNVFDELLTQDEHVFGATSSTSLTARIAEDFARSNIGYKIVFEIHQKSGLAIETISQFSDEKEILMKQGSRFKVKDRRRLDRDPDIVVIEMEEIDG